MNLKLHDYLDIDQLCADLNAGYVDERHHPDLPLTMYTYARSAQFDSHWTDATRKCRGLIVDNNRNIVAFCMPKFFNKSEHDVAKPYAVTLPDEPVRIFDKMDGSMGTIYWYEGQWRVATKGSFLSDQAVIATEMLRSRETRYLNTSMTYVVEIIYPNNRIVVDYGERQDLVLLTSYDSDGTEVLRPVEWGGLGFSYVEEINLMTVNADWRTLTEAETDGTEFEGYVVRFQSGLRAKMKFDNYLALHKILTNCTERTIWEALYKKEDLTKFRENVPDEFDTWVENIVDSIHQDVSSLKYQAENHFMNIVKQVGVADRRLFALEASKLYSPYKSAMFLLYDGKSLRDWAFKLCYPSAVKAFKEDAE